MSELTGEEARNLIDAFNKLKLKPKADTPDDLEAWLKSFGNVKPDPDAVASGTTGTTASIASGSTVKETIVTSQHPRISYFYGDKVKGEVSYAQWAYEVKCLLQEKTHKPETVAQAIRHSLRGEANSIVRRLGIGATVDEILYKFNSVYGEVDTKEHLLAKFYSAKQGEDEDVTKWSCRLEDILSSAVDRKMVDPKNVNEMLRNMFWQGLKPTLKDVSGYKFEKITDFDQLRVELRKIEQDHLHPESNVAHCQVSATPSKKENSEMTEIRSRIQSLSSTIEKLERKVNSNQGGNHGQSFCPSRGKGRYRQRDNSYPQRPYNHGPNQNQQNRQNGFNSYTGSGYNNAQRSNITPNFQFNNPSMGYSINPPMNQRQGQGPQLGRGRQDGHSQNLPQGNNHSQGASGGVEDNINKGPQCYRCWQFGHFQWNCPVRMDHSRQHLNGL